MIFLRRERREGREELAPSEQARGQEELARLARPSRLSLLILVACRSPSVPSGAISIVDDAGDTIKLAAPARRVVSLIPATTELLFAIGADSFVVGRTSYCDYPARAKAVRNLGDGIKPNIEAVISSKPDLVILYNSGQNAAVAGRLQELGVATVRLNTDALSSVPRIAALLGRLTAREKAADSVASVFDTALAAATVKPSSPRPRVLLLIWEQPPMTIGRGSFLNELVERAGAENLFADVAGTDGVVSIEAVAARDPDLVFTTAEGPSGFARRPEWQVVRAVREKRYLHVTGSQFSRPGPRSPMAIRELTTKLRAVTP